MLVLSRKAGEVIKIGHDISIVVRRVAGNRVAIGVDAPHEVRILRGELDPYATEFDEECVSDPGKREIRSHEEASERPWTMTGRFGR